jgi:hypothetical protein
MTVDELRDHGVDHMDGDEIDAFLASHSTGVLGLPTADAPYLLPLSYGYDGDDCLYFFYVLGEESTKDELTARADSARFLVYTVETPFNWRSVLLSGQIRPVPDDAVEAIEASVDIAGRPDLIEAAAEAETTRLYEFEVEDRSGLKHLGLPPGFENPTDDDAPSDSA